MQSPNHIRLLQLAPGGGNTPLRCSLIQVDLDSGHPYEALSYAWGDASDQVPVTCDERSIHITRNLLEALTMFRDSVTTQFLWADAMCIDQTNLQECGAQVQLIGRIYSEASRCSCGSAAKILRL